MHTTARPSRRHFLRTALATSATPLLLPSHVWAASRSGSGPNGRINLGLVGIGMMNRGHLGGFFNMADVAIGARTAQLCQPGNIGHWLCRPLKWNPAKEEFLADAEGNKLRSRESRGPWNKV